MIYIHELAVALQKSPFGCKIGPIERGSIPQADDIASLQQLSNRMSTLQSRK